MSNKVVLGLGGNVGNVQQTLKKCHDLISVQMGSIILKSSFYKTKAWGVENQSDFINQVIVLETNLSATELLHSCLKVELQLGRKRKEKWHERAIDIDILFYNDDIIKQPDLKIPHPYLQERNFVLIPLIEIMPNFVHPVFEETMEALKNKCKDTLNVIKL